MLSLALGVTAGAPTAGWFIAYLSRVIVASSICLHYRGVSLCLFMMFKISQTELAPTSSGASMFLAMFL